MSSLYYGVVLLLICISHAFSLQGLQQVILAEHSPADEVVAAFKKASIIPEVIDLFEPQYVLAVNWTNTTSAQLGNSIPPSKLQDPFHTIQLLSRSDDQPPDDDPDIPANLVLVLTDPDALSRDKPVWSEVCHSILYAHAPYGDARPKQIIEYLPPSPPPKQGAHRYVLLAFAPANGTKEELELSKPADRKHWGYKGTRVGARRWAKENGLQPIAGNFFYSQNPEQ